MKKIFINKSDSLAEIVEKIIEAKEKEVVLVIPRDSVLKESVANFHLIKREAEAVKKEILIESVDEEVLALAKASKIEAVHSFFNNSTSSRYLSDVIVPDELNNESNFENLGEELVGENKEKKKVKLRSRLIKKGGVGDKEEEFLPQRKKRFKFWTLVSVPTLVIFLGGGVWFFGFAFGKASIALNFEKKNWSYQANFLADKSLTKINTEKQLLPAEVFILKKNMVQLFPASGKESVFQKATGKITIYNAYSSKPQILVEATRFATPDGKIFRLTKQVTVPGAEVKDGKIIPSSVEAEVIADKPGLEYNVGPTPHLTIPGFKGTPKYEGFYGALLEGTKGGFAGQKAVPTADDINKAKEKATEVLKNAVKSNFFASEPFGFKILSFDIIVNRLTVDSNTDEKGNFSVFGEVTFRAFGIKEEDIKLILLSLAKGGEEGLVFEDLKIDYSQLKPDFERGIISFHVAASAILKPDFDEEDFKIKVRGKKKEEVRAMILDLPRLQNAKISLWPFWLKSLPRNQNKIKILLN